MTSKNVLPKHVAEISPINGLNAAQRESNNKALLVIWIFVESVLFISLIYANFAVRMAQSQWPPLGVDRMQMALPIGLTLILLVSSFTAVQAVSAFKHDNRTDAVRWLVATILLGIVFVGGVFILLTSIPFRGPYNAMFVALWAVHVTHAIAGLIILGYVLGRTTQGEYAADRHWPVEAATTFWHFLDAMWIILFVVLYLI